MRRRSVTLTIAILVLLLGGSGTALALLLRHEPAFYSRAALSPSAQRSKCSGEFVGEFARLVAGISDKRRWDARFTEEQINSYFEEDFLKEHPEDQPFPEGIREPRVAIEPKRVRVGFRYGTGPWNTVVSIDLRVWLVAKEANMVALEFEGVHAGALPISSQSLLERASETARRHNDIDATWYRHNGHPVLLLRFQSGRSRPTFQLTQLDFHAGILSIGGRSLDTTPQANTGMAPQGIE
jgi:hypothetical protein